MEDLVIWMKSYGKSEDILVQCGTGGSGGGIAVRGYLTKETATNLRDQLNDLLPH